MADVELARAPLGIDRDRGDRIEPEQLQISHVVAGERLVAEVRVDEPKAAEPTLPAADATEIGEHDLRGVADHDVLDRAAAIDENADLAMKLRGLQRHLLR